MASHDHGPVPSSGDQSIRKLGLVAMINLVGFTIELAGGLVFGSVALLGDAFHMLFDALAYVIALGATVIARRSNPSGRWSYGLHRIEPFAAFLNGVLLIPMVLYLVYESYQRYLSLSWRERRLLYSGPSNDRLDDLVANHSRGDNEKTLN